MWLDRFEQVNGQLKVIGITAEGEELMLDPAQMKTSGLGPRTYKAVTVDTSFSEWKTFSARDYASAFGITSGVTENHKVFSIPYEGGSIVCPAWEVQRTLISSPASMAAFVYRPNGLEQVCAPVCSVGNFSAAIIPLRQVHRLCGTEFLLERLTWFYAYPSAYRMWNSIYRHAQSGKIDFDLPKASVQISVHGKGIGDIFYAKHVYALELTPYESPLSWANTNRESFNFTDGTRIHLDSRATSDSRLRPIGNQWDLTDEEWVTVNKLIYPQQSLGKPASKYDARKNVNGIIEKLAMGKNWSELPHSQFKPHSCQYLFHQLQSDGRWDRIADYLARARPEV
jgi:hypothetical protein